MENLIYEAAKSALGSFIYSESTVNSCAQAVARAITELLKEQGKFPAGGPGGPFMTVELFPPMPMSGSPVSDCTECGGYVKMLQQHKHTAWHNKVADL